MRQFILILFMFLPLCVFAVGIQSHSVENKEDNEFRNSAWRVDWGASSRQAAGTGEYMPFWARTGEDGILPVKSSGLWTAGADISYNHKNGIFFEAGTNLVGAFARTSPLNPQPVYGLVDRLYVSGGWKMLRMDIGMIPRHGDLGELSITGGDIMMSGNARNIPGINLSADWIYFEKGHWVGIKGNLAHYQLIDSRMVGGAMLHDKSIAIKFALGRKVDLMAGFHHYAQWGGYSPTEGLQGQSFRDYVKVFFARKGDATDSKSDQLNVFGNHLGNEWARVVWRARPFTMTFQYDKPFEDNSGMKFQNFPDGVWTLQFALNNRKAWVTDITYEFINTTWQSGNVHDRPATEDEMAEQDPTSPWYGRVVIGGLDNYFNNSPYGSGWTNYGRTIGLPLITPGMPVNGITPGIINNRIRGHHLAFAGMLKQKVPYRFKATLTENFGLYHQPFDISLWQLSMAFEVDIMKDVTSFPVALSIGVYGDVGQLYQNSAGLMFKVSYGGFHKF